MPLKWTQTHHKITIPIFCGDSIWLGPGYKSFPLHRLQQLRAWVLEPHCQAPTPVLLLKLCKPELLSICLHAHTMKKSTYFLGSGRWLNELTLHLIAGTSDKHLENHYTLWEIHAGQNKFLRWVKMIPLDISQLVIKTEPHKISQIVYFCTDSSHLQVIIFYWCSNNPNLTKTVLTLSNT